MSIQRDYKPASAWQRRRRSVRRHGLLVITLVLIGLFGGLLAYIRGDRHPQAPAAATTPPVAPAQPARGPATPAAPKVVAPEPAPAPVKPKYDFYTELPKRQVDIQQEEINPRAAPPRQPPARTPAGANQPLRKPAAPPKPGATPTVALASANAVKSGTHPGMASSVQATPSAPNLANSLPATAKTR